MLGASVRAAPALSSLLGTGSLTSASACDRPNSIGKGFSCVRSLLSRCRQCWKGCAAAIAVAQCPASWSPSLPVMTSACPSCTCSATSMGVGRRSLDLNGTKFDDSDLDGLESEWDLPARPRAEGTLSGHMPKYLSSPTPAQTQGLLQVPMALTALPPSHDPSLPALLLAFQWMRLQCGGRLLSCCRNMPCLAPDKIWGAACCRLQRAEATAGYHWTAWTRLE